MVQITKYGTVSDQIHIFVSIKIKKSLKFKNFIFKTKHVRQGKNVEMENYLTNEV